MQSLHAFFPVLAAIAGYLIGSLSFAVIVSRVMGLNDPRTFGSKNPGATNVLRSGNKGAAVATLLLDAAKGWLAVMLVKWFGQPYGLAEGTMGLVGLAAFVGHLYPVFFKFAFGKRFGDFCGDFSGMVEIHGNDAIKRLELLFGEVIFGDNHIRLKYLAVRGVAPCDEPHSFLGAVCPFNNQFGSSLGRELAHAGFDQLGFLRRRAHHIELPRL